MSNPPSDDSSTARFRRGAGHRVGPAGPPPVPGEHAVYAPPITMADLPAMPPPSSPADLLEAQPPTTFGEMLEPHAPEWPEIAQDPGRTVGVVSIVVGFFVGVVGVFIGIASIRQSRRVGLAGALGTAGIVVSVLNIIVGGVIGVSWVRYEVTLSQQCALVGPGQYFTQTGDRVSCH